MKAAPGLDFEKKAGYPAKVVAGLDEVGRGCLAGPVVAGAVLLPPVVDYEAHPWLSEIGDSKLLTPEKREKLAPLIESWALACAVGVATVEEIDQINIYHASHLAMRRALESAQIARDARAAHVLVDGNVIPKGLNAPAATAIVKGDLKCLSIAAASIVAKVWRDRWMVEADVRYPGYFFGVHKGYATPQHSRALKELGPCEIHRKSFGPVAALLSSVKMAVSATARHREPEQAELF